MEAACSLRQALLLDASLPCGAKSRELGVDSPENLASPYCYISSAFHWIGGEFSLHADNVEVQPCDFWKCWTWTWMLRFWKPMIKEIPPPVCVPEMVYSKEPPFPCDLNMTHGCPLVYDRVRHTSFKFLLFSHDIWLAELIVLFDQCGQNIGYLDLTKLWLVFSPSSRPLNFDPPSLWASI